MSVPLEQPARPAPGARLATLLTERRPLIEAAALVIALLVFLVSVLPNLANHPAVTDDEVWVLSASYKLMQKGVFGSDIFAGFYHADSHYLFNMPAHHFVLAGVMKVIGAGILQARLVGVAYGVATLFLTYVLARRLYGVAAAILAIGLLLFLRLNMGFDTGLPLQELAASVRYDLAPVPFALAGVLLLLAPVSLWRSAAAGALFAIAGLLQFYGAFLIPVALVFLALEELPGRRRIQLGGALLAAAVVVALPYGVFVLANYSDFKGQESTLGSRAHLLSPGFYIDSILHEPKRFTRPLGFKEVPKGEDPRLVEPRFLSLREMLVRRPSAKVAVLLGLPAAILFAAWRGLRERRRGDRLLLLCLVGLPLEFMLFESLKLYIYWILVVPFLCVALAGLAIHLFESRSRGPRWAILAGFTGLCLLLFLAEGADARLNGLRTAGSETDYAALGRMVHGYIPAGERVVGSTSLWWPLRDTDYRSYFLLFYVTSPDAGSYRTTVPGYFESFAPHYLVLTRLATEELQKHLSPRDRADFDAYLAGHAEKVVRIEGADAKSYGYVDIWRLH